MTSDEEAGDGERPSPGPSAEGAPSAASADRPTGEGWYDEPPEGWDEDAERSVFGPAPGEGEASVEPGDPKLVHALFVLLGVLVTLAVLADLVGLL